MEPQPTIPVRRQPRLIDQFYLQYEHMASNYASQVFNYERSGYERSDIVQEFKMKIYTTIIAYCNKWTEYQKTGRYKPMPIEYYIKSAMVNRKNDFIKEFNYERVENADKLSIQRNCFDCAVHYEVDSDIDFKKQKCEINGVDLLAGLEGRERQCFLLYIKGFTINKLRKMFSKHFNAEAIIKYQIDRLTCFSSQLMDFKTQTFETYALEED